MSIFKVITWTVAFTLSAYSAAAEPESDASAGVNAVRTGALHEAIVHFSRAIKTPDRSPAWRSVIYNNRGYAYDELGNEDEALSDFAKAIELNPNFAPAYNNRGYLHYRRGRTEAAVADYTKAITLQPGYTEAWRNRAKLYREIGRYADATEDYAAVIRLEPGDVGARVGRALSLAAQGAIDLAIADARMADHLRPGNENIAELIRHLEALDASTGAAVTASD